MSAFVPDSSAVLSFDLVSFRSFLPCSAVSMTMYVYRLSKVAVCFLDIHAFRWKKFTSPMDANWLILRNVRRFLIATFFSPRKKLFHFWRVTLNMVGSSWFKRWSSKLGISTIKTCTLKQRATSMLRSVRKLRACSTG